MNTLTLFSNGIGHFRREYDVKSGKPEKISIPFKTDSIGDVAASLQVFGKVRLDSPPSFTPANSHATSLKIETGEALRSLIRQLSGAGAHVRTRSMNIENAKIYGIDSQPIFVADREETREFVICNHDGKILRVPLDELVNVEFTEEAVRTEIDKALKSNFQKIKPDSTMLEIALSAMVDGDTTAIVQYTVPIAAWKMRYSVRQEKGRFTLDGAAIIDNNTDEDWNDFIISVVTGNPISFNTDIANIVVPRRQFVSLVDGASLGHVAVAEAMPAAAPRAKMMMAARSLSPSYSNTAGFGLESASGGAAPDYDDDEPLQKAMAFEIETKEVGDFSIFTNKEKITILARKSAVVPMFSVPLDQAGLVLLYKEEDHARRPFRTVKFKNESEYSLGKGKVVVYNDGVFSGEAVLETTKPGENRMLPHCLENGVRTIKQMGDVSQKVAQISVSDGVLLTSTDFAGKTEYTLDNKKDEDFKVIIEHNHVLPYADTKVTAVGTTQMERVAGKNATRLYVDLKAKESRVLVVAEAYTLSQTVQVGHYANLIHIFNNNEKLVNDPAVLGCTELQESIDKAKEAFETLKQKKEGLLSKADRARKNIEATKGQATNDTVDQWIKQLSTIESEITSIDEVEMPKTKKEVQTLGAEMTKRLKALSLKWVG